MPGSPTLAGYGRDLLASLVERGCDPALARVDLGTDDRSPALLWATSGAMALTGAPQGPPVGRPAGIAAAAAGAWAAFTAAARAGRTPTKTSEPIDAPALLGERAAVSGSTRGGTTSVGRTSRLLPCRDGWLALNLARPDDRDALPAWLETELAAGLVDAGRGDGTEPAPDGVVPEPLWTSVGRVLVSRGAAEMEDRAALLGMAAARVVAPPRADRVPAWFRTAARGTARPMPMVEPPRIVDLGSLWAGPLCASLLQRVGARVVKVESVRRPDGARRGPTAFHDLLNTGKQSVALDFTRAEDRRVLQRLVAAADIVVESSRPRALAQLGIDAAALVESCPGLTWISITGHGRGGDAAHRVAFGDDAAVAAGLAAAAGSETSPLFCADAVADPLTGLHAALAALCFWRSGGGVLVDVSLRDVAAHALGRLIDASSAAARPAAPPARPVDEATSPSSARWVADVEDGRGGSTTVDVAPPRARTVLGRAASLGAHTREVVGWLEQRC